MTTATKLHFCFTGAPMGDGEYEIVFSGRDSNCFWARVSKYREDTEYYGTNSAVLMVKDGQETWYKD